MRRITKTKFKPIRKRSPRRKKKKMPVIKEFYIKHDNRTLYDFNKQSHKAKQRKQMQENKIKKINPIVKAIINGALSLVDALLVNRIPQEQIKELTLLASAAVRQTVAVLADKNTQDSEQVAAVWLAFVNHPQFIYNIDELISEQINKIEQPHLAGFLNSLLTPLLSTVQALTDNVKPDGQQIASIWKTFFIDINNVKALFALFDPKGLHAEEIDAGAAFFANTLQNILNSINE